MLGHKLQKMMQLNSEGLLIGLKLNQKTTILITMSIKQKIIWIMTLKGEELKNKEMTKPEYLKG